MVISIGENVLADTKDIAAILDMDSITVKERGRLMFQLAKENIVYIDEKELPRSCIVVIKDGKTTVFVSPLNSQTVAKRALDSDITRKDFFSDAD